MLKNFRVVFLFLFIFLASHLVAQQTVSLPPPYSGDRDTVITDSLIVLFPKNNIGFEVGGYPAGQMYGVRFEHYWGKLHNRELNLRVGYNRAFRYNWSGLNDDEQGGGFGFSVGYRHHFQRKGRYNLFLGIRADIWQMSIFWKDYDNTPQKGTTHITVFQPSAEFGVKAQLLKRVYATFYGGIGQEINVSTKGKEVGQGGMYIWGATLGYAIN